MSGLVYFQGPMLLPSLPTDLAEQHALRLIYICLSTCICLHWSFLSLPMYWPTFGLRIFFSKLVGSVIPKVRSTRVTVLLLLLRCAAARRTGALLLP